MEKRVDTPEPYKVQLDTRALLDIGILPHSASERDHATKLLNKEYDQVGGLKYVYETAAFHNHPPHGNGEPALSAPQLLVAQLGFDPLENWRKNAIDFHRGEVRSTLADHMIDYVEDAQLTINAVNHLTTTLQPVTLERPIGQFLYDPTEETTRALAALTRLYETKQYALSSTSQKSRINTNLLDTSAYGVKSRLKEATYDQTVGQTMVDAAELIDLEVGRLAFWVDQLVGHPVQHTSDVREFVARRLGVGDTRDKELQAKVWRGLLDVARRT